LPRAFAAAPLCALPHGQVSPPGPQRPVASRSGSGFTDAGLLRAELRRLFEWLKKRGVTAIITGERGEGQLTRYGIEEYISDCVVLLDNRVVDQVTTRRLRVVK
jgi:KaiC/GvpD/RAD55 family RecA-like ATPase